MTDGRALRIGDTVRLRSGGPDMTVCAESVPVEQFGFVMGEAGWACRWFVQGALKEAVFRPDVLELVPVSPDHGADPRRDQQGGASPQS